MDNGIILKVENLRKEYPGTVALNDVTLEIRAGEVHALVGENGAGKSTLIKAITGAISPTSGSIIIDGTEYKELDPILSKKLGIGAIYQEFNNVPTISAAENVFLCQKMGKSKYFANTKERERLASALFQQLGVDINPSKPVRELSPAHQQIIEIAKAIHQDVSFLIMDEPTAPLTVSEVELLFKIIRDLKSRGIAILYISHRMEEIFEIADRVSVLRDGCYITTKDVKETNPKELISYMVGRTINQTCPSRDAKIGKELLRVEHLTGNGDKDISFNLHEGEVLGFGGLVGSGRTELMEMLYGLKEIESGKIYVDGKEVKITSPTVAMENGIGMISEDRKNFGVFLRNPVSWNVTINAIKNISKCGVVSTKTEKALSKEYIDKFQIKVASMQQVVGSLSGGNQQKVSIAKTMAMRPKIAVFDEPTRGIDVNAKQEIYKLINGLVEDGNAVILISSDMPELLGMSDRIAVLCEGVCTGIISKEEFSQTRVLTLASGQN